MKRKFFSFTPLGGVGEIGKNMALLECGETRVFVDAGLLFPEERNLGVDYVIPDFNEILDAGEAPQAVLLTHGHEDHIGALPYLLQRVNVPVYGTPFTLGLVSAKLADFPGLSKVELREVAPTPGGAFSLGDFQRIEFVPVAHSIADACGLILETSVGRIVHTGDFKIDHTPVDGRRTDLQRFAACGREGVTLLLSDSTNVEEEGTSLSEKAVGARFLEIFRNARGRVVVACFASNLHRVQQAVWAARRTGRKTCVLGRSMQRTVQVASEKGLWKLDASDWLSPEALKNHPPEKTVVVTTGSQGEPLSGMARLAFGEHRDLEIGPGDVVLFSARAIPGNEKAIARLVNHLYRRGAQVLWEKTDRVHASGHACREELKTMLDLVRPRFFVPVHGEYRHLVLHRELAKEMGVPEENAFLLENGDRLVLEEENHDLRAYVLRGEFSGGTLWVDGTSQSEVGEVVLRDRRHLSKAGVVVVWAAVDSATGALLSGPDITARGFSETPEESFWNEAREKIKELLEKRSAENPKDLEQTKENVRRSMQKFFSQKSLRRPVVVPLIVEV